MKTIRVKFKRISSSQQPLREFLPPIESCLHFPLLNTRFLCQYMRDHLISFDFQELPHAIICSTSHEIVGKK